MPNKNIEKRREAWRRWYKKNRNNPILKMKRRARDKAFQTLKSQECSIKNCQEKGERHHEDYEKPLEIIWLCKKHHEKIHSNEKCKKCSEPHRALGLCYNHWRQQHREKKR